MRNPPRWRVGVFGLGGFRFAAPTLRMFVDDFFRGLRLDSLCGPLFVSHGAAEITEKEGEGFSLFGNSVIFVAL